MKGIYILSLASLFVASACASTEQIEKTDTASQPLYLTTMTHMERTFNDDQNELVFNRHVKELRFAMNLAEEYEAVLTVETEKPFARANTLWDLNIMKEVLDRGHGVGTHCDLGGPNGPKLDPELFAMEIRENKELVDALVGPENNHGCSGTGGYSDWAQAMVLAGFDYVNGMVGMHLLAVPEAKRPVSWDDKYIMKDAYHYSFPEDLEQRIYLYRLKDTSDWEADDSGIVVSSGEMGRFDGLAEGGYKNDSTECFNRKCEMTMEDVDMFIALVEQIHATRDPNKVAKMTLYFPVTNFEAENEEVLRAFFEAAKKLSDEGKLEWSTQWGVVEAYLASLNNLESPAEEQSLPPS